jgi:Protein of unknown function, DUF547
MGVRSWAVLAAVALAVTACSTVRPLPATAPAPDGPFSHEAFDLVLGRVVDRHGQVDYRALVADRRGLEDYYAAIAAVSPDSHPARFPSVDSRLAYWLNAYNASVLTAVVRRWPLTSVRDVAPPLVGFFLRQQVVLGGQSLSLWTLENRIVRSRFDEPRVHFALNCASRGCPRLPDRAFVAAALDSQLAAAARTFVDEERNVRVDETARVVHLSSIFDWYEDDFTGWMRRSYPSEPPTLLSYVYVVAGPELRARLSACRDCRVELIPYDWDLNQSKEGVHE